MAAGKATASANKKHANIAPGIELKLFPTHTIAAPIKLQYKSPINNTKNTAQKNFIYMTPCNQPIAVTITANVVIAITIVLS